MADTDRQCMDDCQPGNMFPGFLFANLKAQQF